MKFDIKLKPTDKLGRVLLEPEKVSVEASVQSAFDHIGRYDLDSMAEDLLEKFAEGLGVLTERFDVGLEDFVDLKASIAMDLLAHLRSAPNVLPVFEKDGEPATNRDGLTVVPLKVRGSGRKLVLEIRADEQGELNTDHIIGQIEECFREMLHVAN